MFLLLLSSQLNDGFDFCNFALLLVSVSTYLNFCAEHFETQKLPPEGFGRSSELSFNYNSVVGANIFGDFCNFLRPNGTLGDWKVSQPS